MVYWGSKYKEIAQGVYGLCASNSLKLIEVLITSNTFKTFSNVICSAFHFLEGGEPPFLLLPFILQVTCKIREYSKVKSNTAMKKCYSLADGVERWFRFSSGSKWEKSPHCTAVSNGPCLK